MRRVVRGFRGPRPESEHERAVFGTWEPIGDATDRDSLATHEHGGLPLGLSRSPAGADGLVAVARRLRATGALKVLPRPMERAKL
ncbi:hypothetical protein [Streptomyces gobitricini]|uniref:Uncharacterized protein n=1 Tax=Streptomyces gobitricini TaxID=68211 RepID=A0ABN3LD98_9ACTN